jgi:preprotein translocase subunit SecE
MAMNREQRRMLQKRGEVDSDGEAVTTKRAPNTSGPKPAQERTTPVEFVKEVRGELRKVAWPSRDEVVNYSIVVLITIIFVTAAIAGLDYVFGTLVGLLFDT